MIQFNLLPDVKQNFIKTQRTKRLVISISVVASAIAIAILLILLLSVFVVQKRIIDNLSGNIQKSSNTLKSTPQLTTILTVQSQLNSLASLNSQSPAAGRLFGFLSQLTPAQATISDLAIDFTQNTVTITGNAPNLAVVNAFADNLKFTSYTISGQSGSLNAFSSVVLSSFTFSSTTSPSYTITANFDPNIFNNADNVSLTVGGNQPQAASQEPSIIFSKGS